jgi:hypothetical protein
MDVTERINFLDWLLEKNTENDFTPDEISHALNSFIEEFNNWLTANFQEQHIQAWLIRDYKELDLDNHFLERYNDCIRIYNDCWKKPVRLFITEKLELAMYQLACKRGDFNRF